MADVLRAHGPAYVAANGERVPLVQRRVLAELTACRTPELGIYQSYCDECGEIFFGYNSCRNRHCVTCGGPGRARWMERMYQDLLPVPYFHLIFTLPEELRSLALGNRREVYPLLFHAAWASMKELAADPRHLGGTLGAVMVLHTWKQDLGHHPHVHAVVPGGGLSPEGLWIDSRSPRFLLPVKALRTLFRGKFLAGLKRLHHQGRLKLEGPFAELADRSAFGRWLSPLYDKSWQVYSQAAPDGCTDAQAVLKYLARYVVGGVIADHRLISHENGRVTFMARQGKGKRQRQKPMTLDGTEFVRRFLIHVLPPGMHRVRYYGLLSNPQRADQLARCRTLIEEQVGSSPLPAPPAATATKPLCPSCGRGHLLLIASEPSPSWRDVLANSAYAYEATSLPASPAMTTPSYEDTS